jgi:glycosyltransferase involved in cell wall biosynthesis
VILENSAPFSRACISEFPIFNFFQTPAEVFGMSVTVVIPVFNEVDNLRLLHDSVQTVMRKGERAYEIIFVNDGSTDGSDEILAELASCDSTVKVIEFRRNFGQTAAMQAGINAASMEVIVFMDADLQNEPADIPMMLDKIDEGYDLVHGWRRDRQDRLFDRRIPSRLANMLISFVTRFPVHDLGCTLKAIRSEIARELQLMGEMHRFIPVLAYWRGARCVEIPVRHHPRRFGKSKYGLDRTFRVLLDLITVKYFTQYAGSPMKLFGGFGLVSLFGSFVSGFALIAMKFFQISDVMANPLLLITAMTFLMGIQFLSFGMLGEVMSRTHVATTKQPIYTIRRVWNFEEQTIRMGKRRAA